MLKIIRVPAVAVAGKRGQVTGNQAVRCGLTGQSDEPGIDFLGFVCQPLFFQGNGICLKGGGIDDVGACLGIALLQGKEGLGMLQNPFFCAAALGHSRQHQVGTGSTVQKMDAAGKIVAEFLLCHHMRFLIPGRI